MKLLNKTTKSFNKMKAFEVLLFVLLLLYLISGISTPYELAPYVNNIFTQLSLFAIVAIIFLCGNIMLALLFSIVVVVFIKRSSKVDHKVIAPSQKNTDNKLKTFNNNLVIEKTLEEEMVGQVVKKPDNIPSPSTYHPVLCESHNATNL